MKMPQWLIGITIIFWGWQTGLWFVALPMALIYEASYFLRWRWELSNKEFLEVGKLCTLLLVGVLLYLILANGSVYWIFEFLTWLPVIFFPFVVAQAYSTSDRMDIRMFFYVLRRSKSIAINLTYPFFALCLMAASVGNQRGISFYLGMFLLSGLALWFVRSARFSPIVWLGLFILAGSIGILGHLALHRLHRIVEHKAIEFLSNIYSHHHFDDPTARSTAIGDIGSVKLDNRILFRVKPEAQAVKSLALEPLLLRRVGYNKYQAGTWISLNSEFATIPSQSEQNSWALAKKANKNIDNNSADNISTITITSSLKKGQNYLNLPQGTRQIIKLPGKILETNQYGTVRFEGEPGLISYQVQYSPNLALDSPPTQEDLQIPPTEQAAIDSIIEQLNLKGKSDNEILQEVSRFFNQEFTYSLDLAQPKTNSTPLSAFLLDHRSGHCEYFATAAALLLRDLAIPTRYIVGYSVNEYSPWENQFVVRSRDSHAWTIVYINGTWQEFDPTPSAWIAIEDANSSKLVFIQDLFSLVQFKLAFLMLHIKSGEATYFYWLLIIPLGFILLRQFKISQGVKRVNLSQNASADLRLGIDSEIYLIESVLKESGIVRKRTETWSDWLAILVQNKQFPPDLITDLETIVQLHYRYRFDPQGISELERKQLRSITRSWVVRSKPWLEKIH